MNEKVDIEKGLSGGKTSSENLYVKFNIISFGSLCNCILSTGTLAFLALLVFECKDYIQSVLVWVENQESWAIYLILVSLFTIVSFPFTWGYLFLNIACGYLFGIIRGFVAVVITAVIGVFIAHSVIRMFFTGFALMRLFNSDYARAMLRVISGPQAFKVVAFARLTPIPFGLQNTIFAVSSIGSVKYILATMVGLLPTQAINVYLGSTLRSMEDVLSDETTAFTGYIVFAVQILIGVSLMVFVVHKARLELRKALEQDLSTNIQTLDSKAFEIVS
ncbi:transmembrane protein 64 isoform X1 [Ischnura elegans]|uniref:transmembrane protein 64 isoform X1 n=1 Tax=Ischnura elegans TaxID=197161 RepID=UPI001ED86B0E|nr:transmembrane protein 64 isoform X1 [Ischnura elegans]